MQLTIDGREVAHRPGRSLLQAWTDAGLPLVTGAGCAGQAVCGSCRALVRRAGADEVTAVLMCATPAEPGMRVSRLDPDVPRHDHVYELARLDDAWTILGYLGEVFPEAAHCRHCGGCDRVCPEGIAVEGAVEAACAGQVKRAAAAFDLCVMCDLCTAACPEDISPNHLGLFLRRITARLTLRPADLVLRLRQIEQGLMTVDMEALDRVARAVAGADGGGAPR